MTVVMKKALTVLMTSAMALAHCSTQRSGGDLSSRQQNKADDNTFMRRERLRNEQNARAKCAKQLFFVVEYANYFMTFLPPSPRGCSSHTRSKKMQALISRV